MSKFKNVEALEKSYKELEKMFTKKCKECAEKENKIIELESRGQCTYFISGYSNYSMAKKVEEALNEMIGRINELGEKYNQLREYVYKIGETK